VPAAPGQAPLAPGPRPQRPVAQLPFGGLRLLRLLRHPSRRSARPGDGAPSPCWLTTTPPPRSLPAAGVLGTQPLHLSTPVKGHNAMPTARTPSTPWTPSDATLSSLPDARSRHPSSDFVFYFRHSGRTCSGKRRSLAKAAKAALA